MSLIYFTRPHATPGEAGINLKVCSNDEFFYTLDESFYTSVDPAHSLGTPLPYRYRFTCTECASERAYPAPEEARRIYNEIVKPK